ncbi:MAG: aminoacetone oxidase family FAD-binding enzyme, partial [Eubacteriales bacterium]
MSKTVAVIGGGPAGMMAAISAAKAGHKATLFEQNEKLGKKLFLTGKGRCNITNTADISDFFLSIPRNNKFLYSALYGFTNMDLLDYFHSHGLKTKEERGGRVFPESDKSSDVTKALEAGLKEANVTIRLRSKVEALKKKDEAFVLTVNGKPTEFDAVIIATGGLSYPSTGSDGKFFNVVKALGHTTSDFEPSLISLKTLDTSERPVGLTLKN